jgi:hypothetical protein
MTLRPSIRDVLTCALLGAIVLAATACGSTPSHTGMSADTATGGRSTGAGGPAYFERVREAVLRGAVRDFAQGTGIGGPAYGSCVRRLLGRALDRPTIMRLVAVYRRPGGQQFAAQALNRLASPLGASCGHRWYVPELVEASRGLREGRLTGAAVAKLGVVYGPFLGDRCGRADHVGCGRVGIDVVLKSSAGRVVAVMGGRRLRLHTPGMHSGVRYHDWVGTLANAGMDRPTSPFYVNGYGRSGEVWAGSPPVYVPVQLRVWFADGRRESALFPRVFLSPGWG